MNHDGSPDSDEEALDFLLYRQQHGSKPYGEFAAHTYRIYRTVRKLGVLDSYCEAVATTEYVFGYTDADDGSGDVTLEPMGEICGDGDGGTVVESEGGDKDGDGCDGGGVVVDGDASDCKHCQSPGEFRVSTEPPQANQRRRSSAAHGRRRQSSSHPRIVQEQTLSLHDWGGFTRDATEDEVQRGVRVNLNLQPLRVQLASQLLMMAAGAKLHNMPEYGSTMPDHEELSQFAVEASSGFVEKVARSLAG